MHETQQVYHVQELRLQNNCKTMLQRIRWAVMTKASSMNRTKGCKFSNKPWQIRPTLAKLRGQQDGQQGARACGNPSPAGMSRSTVEN